MRRLTLSFSRCSGNKLHEIYISSMSTIVPLLGDVDILSNEQLQETENFCRGDGTRRQFDQIILKRYTVPKI